MIETKNKVLIKIAVVAMISGLFLSFGASFVIAEDATPPTIPTIPAPSINPNDGTFTLTWTASSDDSGIAYYELQRSRDKGFTFTTIASSTTNSYNETDLLRGKYIYRVRAVDTVGNKSAFSPVLPRGIYALDGSEGTYRDGRIRDYDFVEGYAWRMMWSDFETAEGVYDFSGIDYIISRLESIGKKLSILSLMDPAYITATPGVTTWSYIDPVRGDLIVRAVPWDPYLLSRFQAFTKALGDHLVPNAAAGGALTPLRDHPTLANIQFGIPGLGPIREAGFEISDIPGYTRQNLLDAIKTSLQTAVDEFPNKFVSVGFWRVTDATPTPALWEDIRAMVLTEFNGVQNPKVGFFEDNLAASKNLTTGVVTGYPSTTYAAPLYLSRNSTHIMFQALTSWRQPFTGADKVANATPKDGLEYAYNTFDSSYCELYVPDLDYAAYQPSLAECNNQAISLSFVTVNNHPPVASNQELSTNEDTLIPIVLIASDIDGDTLAYSIVTYPASGTLSGSAPDLIYTPNSNYNGEDSFAFKVSDGTADSNIATVSITVNPLNEAPVLDMIGNKLAEENNLLEFTVSAQDRDGDALIYSATNLPPGGTFANQTFSWMPQTGDAARYENVHFEVTDGTLIDSEDITIVVNAPLDSPVLPTKDGLELTLSNDGSIESLMIDGSNLIDPASTYNGFSIREMLPIIREPASILLNSSLEDGDSNGVPDGWVFDNGVSTNIEKYLDSLEVRTGTYSLYMGTLDSAADGGGLWRSTAVTDVNMAGKKYRFGGYIKVERGHFISEPAVLLWQTRVYSATVLQTRTGFYLEFYNHSNVKIRTDTLALRSNANNWKRLTREVVAPEGAVKAKLCIVFANQSGKDQGIWVDDVTLYESPEEEVPLSGAVAIASDGCLVQNAQANPDINLTAVYKTLPTYVEVDTTITDTSGTDKALEVIYSIPIEAEGWNWHSDVRNAEPIDGINGPPVYGGIVNGDVQGYMPISLYPYAAIDNELDKGLSIGISLDKPVPYYIDYDNVKNCYEIHFYVGLSPNALKMPSTAKFTFYIFKHDPKWGFRSTIDKYCKAHPDWFSSCVDYSLFSGWSQKAEEVRENHAQRTEEHPLGIYTAVYTIPESGVQNPHTYPATGDPPTYDQILTDFIPTKQLVSLAVDTNSDYIIKHVSNQTSWEPNYWDVALVPNMDDEVTSDGTDGQARLNWTRITTYFNTALQYGEVLDGVEIDNFYHSPTVDFDPSHIGIADYSLTYSFNTYQPGVYTVSAMKEFLISLREKLDVTYGKCKGISANFWSLGTVNFITGYLDNFVGEDYFFIDPTTGEEKDIAGNKWADWNLNYRRATAYQRYISTVTKIPSSVGNPPIDVDIESSYIRFADSALFYGIGGGVKIDNGDTPIPEHIADIREVYKELAMDLTDAKWEPITYTETLNPDVWIERFGQNPEEGIYFAIHNAAEDLSQSFGLKIHANELGISDTANLDIQEIIPEPNATPVPIYSYTQSDGYITLAGESINAADTRVFKLTTIPNNNNSPILSYIPPTLTGQEGEWFTIPKITATDPDGDTLTMEMQNAPGGMRFFPVISVAGYAEYKLRWPDKLVEVGTYDVTFVVSDGELIDQETITITINDVNQSPILSYIPPTLTGQEGEWFTIPKITATDPDGDTLTMEMQNAPGGVRFFQTDSRPGYVEYKLRWPDKFVKPGTYENIIFTVRDRGIGDPDILTDSSGPVTIQIADVNLPPLLCEIGTKNGRQGVWFTIPKIIAQDADGDNLIIEASGLPNGARFFVVSSTPGRAEYKMSWPDKFVKEGTYGPITFTVRDRAPDDPDKKEDSKTATIIITP